MKEWLHGLILHISFLDFWRAAFDGKFRPVPLVFFASMAVFFLFATVKVLDSRKWL